MTIPESDPRLFIAAERTLLAWLRTGLTIIALGFVVAKFGLFLEPMSVQRQAAYVQDQRAPSVVLGVLFVVVGVFAILLATVQHRRFILTLAPSDRPMSYSRAFAVVLSCLVGILGILLVAYLVVSRA